MIDLALYIVGALMADPDSLPPREESATRKRTHVHSQEGQQEVFDSKEIEPKIVTVRRAGNAASLDVEPVAGSRGEPVRLAAAATHLVGATSGTLPHCESTGVTPAVADAVATSTAHEVCAEVNLKGVDAAPVARLRDGPSELAAAAAHEIGAASGAPPQGKPAGLVSTVAHGIGAASGALTQGESVANVGATSTAREMSADVDLEGVDGAAVACLGDGPAGVANAVVSVSYSTASVALPRDSPVFVRLDAGSTAPPIDIPVGMTAATVSAWVGTTSAAYPRDELAEMGAGSANVSDASTPSFTSTGDRMNEITAQYLVQRSNM
ncbi:hypothetical protein K1T71_008177 [Dendrolimus kikuchii]|uniref:Uncharacterized protein n=1 Tax=Dendrolimus kikuchii TaxID=765133 RepID=A0ACC1CWH6_9NEOP|nr:hypothetical protein K1T71_008177 [Dendrolimus kikuchii]